MKTINFLLVMLASTQLLVWPQWASGEQVKPRHLDVAGFEGVVADAGNVILAGQPDQDGLTWAKREGVTTIINLRTAEEMEKLDWDEKAAADELGLAYIDIPLGRSSESYSPEIVTEFASALAASKGRVLVHCGSARRVSYLWAAHLYRNEGFTLIEALEYAKAANFGTLPLEGLLGEDLTTLLDE